MNLFYKSNKKNTYYKKQSEEPKLQPEKFRTISFIHFNLNSLTSISFINVKSDVNAP